MSELKKIAADLRSLRRVDCEHGEHLEIADALDALAAQTGEPVAWQDTAKHDVLVTHDALDPMWKPMMRPLYAAPQPVTVSREALLEAFMIYADPQMVRVTYNVEKLRALGIEVTP